MGPDDARPPRPDAIEAMGENFRTEDFFKPGWETYEAKTSFFAPYLSQMRDDGYIQRVAAGPAAHRMAVVDPETDEAVLVYMLGSNNYLGFGNDPFIKKRTIEAIEAYGVGVGGPPLLNGTTKLHVELERKLAELKRTEDCVLFSSGYAANVGWATALLGRGDILLYDALSHASLFDGMRMGRFEALPFAHNGTVELRKRLMEIRWKQPYTNIFVCVEGVYSMDGDVAPLDEIVSLCDKYAAQLVVDDAHGTGVMGARGHGTPEHFGLEGRSGLIMGTFSKTFAVSGGFVAGPRETIDYLRFFARSHMFSAALPPPVVAAVLAGIELLEREPERVARLASNARYLAAGLERLGFRCRCETAIIPVPLPPSVNPRAFVHRLHQEGVFVNGISYPAVPKNLQRLRISMMSTFTEGELDEVLAAFERVGREFGVIGG